MSLDYTSQTRELLITRGLITLDEPVELSSGARSRYFIDGKAALARGRDLAVACRAMIDEIAALGIEFDAVGGLTLGADQFAHGIALLDDKEWFVIRKQAKGRGTNQLVEGARLDQDSRVLLVDDIVTTGGSIQVAYERVLETHATVVAASTLADRGDVAGAFFAERGVPYAPLMTYRELGIPAVGTE